MPLRDHFHPPILDLRPWESFHTLWPGEILRLLLPRLPQHYYALPGIHLGPSFEVDLATFKTDELEARNGEENGEESGGGLAVATAVWAPPRTVTVALPEEELVELRIHDERRRSRLVAVVEVVSPANKDRPASRAAFVVKCASYLRQFVSVVVVDVVTERHANLHAELLELLQAEVGTVHALSATSYRMQPEKTPRLEVWHEPLVVGRSLPTVPLWLSPKFAVPLELEKSYEEVWKLLRLP